jgi:hypothetical protein
MESSRFDEFTKALATPTSRRQALRRIGGILGGTTLAGLFPRLASADNSACAHFCASVFGANTTAAGQCTSDAAHGRGLCYTCGPASHGGTQPMCCPKDANGFCSSYTTATCCGSSATCLHDACCPNSLVCGTTCLAAACDGSKCLACNAASGTCQSSCSTTQTCLKGTCCDNALVCGSTCCGSNQVCSNGLCCPAGQTNCGGKCVDTQTDPKNCGTCGTTCSSAEEEVCISGQCHCRASDGSIGAFINGVCFHTCTSDATCPGTGCYCRHRHPSGQTIAQEVCLTDTGVPLCSGIPGTCPSGQLCLASPEFGTLNCYTVCNADTDCPSGYACVENQDGDTSYCGKKC